MPKVGSLFSGIGGMDLGLERAGFTVAWQVEKDEYACRILTKHWPDVVKFNDVRNVGKHNLDPVDLIAGGPPCQPFSLAGQRRGAEDDRNLWPEMRRVIAELKPNWVLFENVAGIIGIYAHVVADDLEALGYEVGAFTLPAASVGAPHFRERLFIVAHANFQQHKSGTYEKRREKATFLPVSDTDVTGQQGKGISILSQNGRKQGYYVDIVGCGTTISNSASVRCSRWADLPPSTISEWLTSLERDNPWSVEPNVGRVAYGVPNRVDRIRGLGNAVVPQVAEFIGRIIYEIGRVYGEW